MDAARLGHHECLSILLAHGAEVNKAYAVSIRGVCSIAYLYVVACIGVAAEGMHYNLRCRCCRLQDGFRALMMAAQEGHHECLSILLAHGAEVDKADAVSVRGVCSIAYLWDVACIGVVVEGMRYNLHCLCCHLQDGHTAVVMAAHKGHHECLSILLAHGAEVDKTNPVSVRGVCSIAFLWDAACYGVAAELMLCNLHCLCYQLQYGSTALIIAAREGHHECLSILLAHGAEVNKAYAVSVRGVCSIAS